ncbi:MAG: hypothetical protein ACKOTZ_07085 [Chloroflexota bacterium]
MRDRVRRRSGGLLLAVAAVGALAGCTAIASAGPDGGAWTPPPAAPVEREAQKCSVLTDPPCFGAAAERAAESAEKPPYVDGAQGRDAQAAAGGWPDPTPDVPAPSPLREAAADPSTIDCPTGVREGSGSGIAIDPCQTVSTAPEMNVAKAIRPDAVIFGGRQASSDCPGGRICELPFARFALPEERGDGAAPVEPGAPGIVGGYIADPAPLAPGIFGFGGGAEEAEPLVGTAQPDAAIAPSPNDLADHVLVCIVGSGAEAFALGAERVTDAGPVAPLADGRIPVCIATAEAADAAGLATAVLGWEDGRTVRIEAADPVSGRVPFGVVPLAGGGRPVALVVGDRPAAIDVDGHTLLVDRVPLANGSAVVRVEVRSAQGAGQCGSCWAYSAAPDAGRTVTGGASPDRTASILSLTLEEARAWADWVAGGGSLEPAIPLGPDGSPLPGASPDPAASAAPVRGAAGLAELPGVLCVRPERGIRVRATGTVRPALRGLPDGSDALCWDHVAGTAELRATFAIGELGYVVRVLPGDTGLRADVRHAGGAPIAAGPIGAGDPFEGLDGVAFTGVVVDGGSRPDAVIFDVADR